MKPQSPTLTDFIQAQKHFEELMPLMITKSTHSVLHFSSRIHFVTRREFDNLPITHRKSDTYLRGSLDTFNKAAHTRGIIMCNAGGVVLMNQEKIMLFHFLGDETKPHGQELRQLTDAIKGLKQQNPKLRALLVGGQSFWPFSSELGEGIKRLFEKERIPFSVFWGHNDEMGQSHIAYDARRDTWYVSTLGDDRYTPYNAFEVLDLPQLKGAFEEIALDSGDVVVLGNQTYRSAEVNQSRRKPF